MIGAPFVTFYDGIHIVYLYAYLYVYIYTAQQTDKSSGRIQAKM